ncbi:MULTISPECIES: phage major tail protein, TP901-1 family [Convivina]|uniref:TP901-1 family phage major tail protein n=1 Tax=Convivina intestini TaxID=1505726 RepID=A0A2U1D4E6_9LACO|nr:MULTISPECIES: phage major tail protein, TP901-1 family [Convivina]PVY82545.1 TP901-1 family phage major tail protein [Convivina intestini]CAH1856735.1 hypothetical protein R077815_01474 [Convivina sp. LMG 32447]CAH1857124.1 hypothetical protein R078138_01509 [Convivina sp. LMG 32447]SDC17087.1 phage major tail protein, TP901-1 family [Leuconostocaceae bacterium R-53105]
MAEDLKAKSGGKAIVFVRLRENESKTRGIKAAYQTTYSYKLSRDKKSEDTKDGKVQKGGSLDGTLSLELLASNQSVVKNDLDDAINQDKEVEFWIAYTDTPGTKPGTCAGRYMRAHMTSSEETGDSDNSVSLKLEASINGGYARKGDLSLDANSDTDVSYDFQDLGVVTGSEQSNNAQAPK